MTQHDLKNESIRIGTLVQGRDGRGVADYIRQILPYGFESLSLFFGRRRPASIGRASPRRCATPWETAGWSSPRWASSATR